MQLEITSMKTDEDGWTCMIQVELKRLQYFLATDDVVSELSLARLPGKEMSWCVEGSGVLEEFTILFRTRERAEKFIQEFDQTHDLEWSETVADPRMRAAKARKAKLEGALNLLAKVRDEMLDLGFFPGDRDFTRPEESLGDELNKFDWLT